MTKNSVISPAQGLLILIDKYKNNPGKFEELKKLYLMGADGKDNSSVKEILKDKLLDRYEISYEKSTINNDPTRRYFETHLAYETLKGNVKDIEIEDLQNYNTRLLNIFPPEKGSSFQAVLSGNYEGNAPMDSEYSHYISKLNNNKIFSDFSDEDKQKINLLISSCYLGVMAASMYQLPIGIYGTGIYSEQSRGKQTIDSPPDIAGTQQTTRTQNLGLLKSSMPLPSDDIAYSDTIIPYLKAADRSTYVEQAQWVEDNFSKLVHPFSNSISGTMLCQLRSLAFFKDKNGQFTESSEKMANFYRLAVSTLLYDMGGHSLNEFVTPITLPEVKKEFSSISNFDQIGLQSMFYKGNENNYQNALDDAITYNKQLLLRKNVHAEIIKNGILSNAAENSVEIFEHKLAGGIINNVIDKIESGINKAFNKLNTLISSEGFNPLKDMLLNVTTSIKDKFGKKIDVQDKQILSKEVKAILRKVIDRDSLVTDSNVKEVTKCVMKAIKSQIKDSKNIDSNTIKEIVANNKPIIIKETCKNMEKSRKLDPQIKIAKSSQELHSPDPSPRNLGKNQKSI